MRLSAKTNDSFREVTDKEHGKKIIIWQNQYQMHHGMS